MALVADGRVLAALDILSKEIEHAGERYAASGLSTVVTDEAVRRRGHGRRLVSAAREAIAASGADLGIFTCDRPLGPFYESAGWTVVPGAVLVGGTPDAPFPSDQWDKVTLAAFFSAKARRGAPSFADSRIGLYPGASTSSGEPTYRPVSVWASNSSARAGKRRRTAFVKARR